MHPIYEALIEGIAPEEKVQFARRGPWRSYVECSRGGGVASLLLAHKQPYLDSLAFPEWVGRPLRDLAACLVSEDALERALGCAALTSYYNSPAGLSGSSAEIYPPEEDKGNVFDVLAADCRDKIVGTVGHFHGGEKLTGMRELRVFEKEPRPGDYPETREEDLLPECEIVVITGMALTNGTMPHVLELAKNGYVALSGPSVPFSKAWFGFGVDALFGTMVWNPEACRDSVAADTHESTWKQMGKIVWKK